MVSCEDILAFAARDSTRKVSGGDIDYLVASRCRHGQTFIIDEANTKSTTIIFQHVGTYQSF